MSIDNMIKSDAVQDSTTLFYETTYVHEQNKQEYRQYLMNRDGFALLVMGFTGRKAMQFKMKYINAFNQMEKVLKQPNSRKLLLETALEHEKEIENIKTDVNYLKDNMRISGAQEYQINQLGKKKVRSEERREGKECRAGKKRGDR